MAQQEFMPILFKVLFGFVLLNMVVNFILLLIHKKRLYKLLAVFWPSVLVVFILQSVYQTIPFNIALAYSATFLPMTIFAMIGFEAAGRKFPLKKYLVLYALTYPLMLTLFNQGYGFTVFAMPIALGTAAPLMHSAYLLLIKERHKTTRLQKLLGAIFFIMPFHCINFAIFRMVEETQLWGWLVSYALYDTLAVVLPSIALEESKLFENQKLQKLVDEKTAHLQISARENEGLLKILLHDISNPLMVIKHFIDKLEKEVTNPAITKIARSANAIEEIVLQVKERYRKKNILGALPLKPVAIEDCFNEVSFIFAQSLEKKKISLKFTNYLPARTKVLADEASLTHSVLSNLVSNGLKFSAPHSEIEITAREVQDSVVLEVKDKGPGISQEVIDSLMNHTNVLSTEGTEGEQGNGFGLSIVKSFVQSYGGEIEFESKFMAHHPQDHGTSVRITFDRA